jgi:hypothetical protein
LARRQVARSAGQQLEPVLETLEQRAQRQQPRPVGRQLDRERQAVQARADGIDDRRVLVDRIVAEHGPRARKEQRRGVRRGQRLHAVDVLGRESHRRSAGREHREVRHRGEKLTDLLRVVEVAVETVEHHERRSTPRHDGQANAELDRARGYDAERGRHLRHEHVRGVGAVETDMDRSGGKTPRYRARPPARAASCPRHPGPRD